MMKRFFVLFFTPFIITLAITEQTFAFVPANATIHMTESPPIIWNGSGQPQQQFERGDTVIVNFQMYNYGPDTLDARVVLDVKDSDVGPLIYDDYVPIVVEGW